ncbi:MAG: hypothetical protein LAT56_17145, partial [Wenzhouxiangella sp.]|nr:hypothetical protein [Wenzhouxiangella sp.]
MKLDSRGLLFMAAVFVAAMSMTSDASAANAGEGVEARDSCLDFVLGWTPTNELGGGELEVANGIAGRGEALAKGLLRVEAILKDAGMTPSEFSGGDLAWVAVLEADRHRVAVYRVSETRLERLGFLQTDQEADLEERFKLAERALVATPPDCSRSFGVLDIGITSGEGETTLYSIQLVDRSQELA